MNSIGNQRTSFTDFLSFSTSADEVEQLFRTNTLASRLHQSLHATFPTGGRCRRQDELSVLWSKTKCMSRKDFSTSEQLQIKRNYAILVEVGVPRTCSLRIISNVYETTSWFTHISVVHPKREKVNNLLLGNRALRTHRREVIWTLLELAICGEMTSPALLAQAVMTVAAVLPEVATETAELTYAQRVSLVEKQLANKLRLQ